MDSSVQTPYFYEVKEIATLYLTRYWQSNRPIKFRYIKILSWPRGYIIKNSSLVVDIKG